MIITIHGSEHAITVGDTGEGTVFIGFNDEDEAYVLSKADAAALMENLKIILFRQ